MAYVAQGRGSYTSFLVDLNGGLVLINSNNLTGQEVMSDLTLKRAGRSVYLRSDIPGRSVGGEALWDLTSSYMAQPIMFSATTTGPEMEKMEPCS